MTSRDPNSRFARWNLLLQQHNFEIHHRAGRLHQNADAFSSGELRSLLGFQPSLDPQNFREAQNADPMLHGLLSRCRDAADGSSE